MSFQTFFLDSQISSCIYKKYICKILSLGNERIKADCVIDADSNPDILF